MKVFDVIDKGTNQLVYSYESEVAIEWDAYPYSQYKHEPKEITNINPIEVVAPVRITKLAFRNRFTTTEKATLEFAASDDPALPAATRQFKAILRAYLNDVNAATYVDLTRADTKQGVGMLEQYGLIAAGRASQILDLTVKAEEVFNG